MLHHQQAERIPCDTGVMPIAALCTDQETGLSQSPQAVLMVSMDEEFETGPDPKKARMDASTDTSAQRVAVQVRQLKYGILLCLLPIMMKASAFNIDVRFAGRDSGKVGE